MSEDEDDIAESERTVPDVSVFEDAEHRLETEVLSTQEARAKAEAMARAQTAAVTGEALDVDAAGGPPIPPPKLARSAEGGRRLDGVGVLGLIAFVLVGGLLVFGFAQALVPAAEAQLGAACRPLAPEPRSGPAPELELEDLEGKPVSLEQFRGKFLVVNFWATWCEPCTREWPDLDTLGARLAEREDLEILAISVDQDAAAIGPYLERMGLSQTPVTILRARQPEAHQLFGSEKIPDTYFVSPEGELEAVFVNVREWGRAKAVRCVEVSAGR